jgi:hypothetical protein
MKISPQSSGPKISRARNQRVSRWLFKNACFGGTYHLHLQVPKSAEQETRVLAGGCSKLHVSEEHITSIFRVQNQPSKKPEFQQVAVEKCNYFKVTFLVL